MALAWSPAPIFAHSHMRSAAVRKDTSIFSLWWNGGQARGPGISERNALGLKKSAPEHDKKKREHDRRSQWQSEIGSRRSRMS